MSVLQRLLNRNKTNLHLTIEKELKSVDLQNGEVVIVNQKPFQIENGDNSSNKSEILIDMSDNEEINSQEEMAEDLKLLKSDAVVNLPKHVEDKNVLNSDFDKMDLRVNSVEIQTNTNARIKDGYIKNKDDIKSLHQSSIFCSYQNKYQFHLKFYASDVKMTFLRQTERRMTDDKCDKYVQPRSVFFYTTYVDNKSSKRLLMKKNHVLVTRDTEVWKSRTETASIDTHIRRGKKYATISNTESPKIKNYLYLSFNSVEFVSHPDNMTIESMKNVSDDERNSGEPGDTRKNHATILIKFKSDLLHFQFQMVDITLDQIWLKTSRATQSKDRNSYIKYYSASCYRNMFCAIPISTYKYMDPMIKKRYDRRTLHFCGISPPWMREEKINRLKRFCKLKEISAVRRFELNFVSTIQFESQFGSICKIKTKILNGKLLEGDYHYERMALNFQRMQSNIRKKEKEVFFMTQPKHSTMEVLDHNLTWYDY